mmetsp:Transcript_49266/g.107191  ORF Transcript_49266/g.107191 Transcript_49266/m.107191 type:complete len:299 (+) Transcript_49266:92-988(+)
MDDFRGDRARGLEDEDGFDSVFWIVGLLHIVGVAVLTWLLCKCCCSKAAVFPKDGAGKVTVRLEHMQDKKCLSSSYLLWFFFGLLGSHHFYLDRLVHGIVCVWTLNFLGVGWVLDGLLLPFYVRGFNARRTSPLAPWDTSRRRLWCRLPLLALCLLTVLLTTFLYLPRALNWTKVLDVDRLRAQTQANPYDVLGVTPGASLAGVRAAYRKESLRWHPDRNHGCGRECDEKMAEITKAFELVKRRAAPPEDQTWGSLLQELRHDWWLILEAMLNDHGREESDERSTTTSASQAGRHREL